MLCGLTLFQKSTKSGALYHLAQQYTVVNSAIELNPTYIPGMGSINRVKLLHMTSFFNMIMFLCMDAYSEEKLAELAQGAKNAK